MPSRLAISRFSPVRSGRRSTNRNCRSACEPAYQVILPAITDGTLSFTEARVILCIQENSILPQYVRRRPGVRIDCGVVIWRVTSVVISSRTKTRDVAQHNAASSGTRPTWSGQGRVPSGSNPLSVQRQRDSVMSRMLEVARSKSSYPRREMHSFSHLSKVLERVARAHPDAIRTGRRSTQAARP